MVGEGLADDDDDDGKNLLNNARKSLGPFNFFALMKRKKLKVKQI